MSPHAAICSYKCGDKPETETSLRFPNSGCESVNGLQSFSEASHCHMHLRHRGHDIPAFSLLQVVSSLLYKRLLEA